MKVLASLIFRDRVFPMVCFVMLLNCTPTFDTLSQFYMTDRLGFTETDLADFSTVGNISYIVGLIIYSKYLVQKNPKMLYFSTNFLWLIVNISFMLVVFDLVQKWGMNNKFFCFLNTGLASMISEINFMPIIAIWCDICPKNLEATSITLFTGLINFSYNISSWLGSLIQIIVGIDEKSLDKIWIPLLIQNGYLLVMTVWILFIKFPSVKKESQEIL